MSATEEQVPTTPAASTTELPPPVVLLPDVPTLLDDDDGFAHRSYVTVLAETLRHASQPLTIGLFGPWGVGKSSVLGRLRRELCSPDCAFVLFDAWRYDSATLRRQLLRDTATQLQEQGGLDPNFDVAKRLATLEVDQQITTTRLTFSRSAFRVALIQAAVVAASAWAVLQIGAVSTSLFGQDPKRGGLIALAFGAITLLSTTIGQLFQAVPYVETRRRLDDPERFHELFRDLVKAVRASRLVVSVDNLDRCAPEDALELLATIKTYLEPAADQANADRKQGTTEVLFLLAVDENALRAHLSGTHANAERVDEYLGKIFGATIRFVPLLHEDLRTYVRGKLEQIRTSLRLTTEQEQQLVSLIDVALRTNPRQVLQFLNNFQLRLRLIRERERRPGAVISDRISEAPLMVAKLALIEDCWPGYHADLVDRPQQLEQWHREARDPTFRRPGDLTWARFAAFLRISDGIRTDDLRAYLRLKQSSEERSLPEFESFRTAAVGGDRDAIAAILTEHAEHTEQYLERLHHTFLEELGAGSPLAARSVLDVALSEPRIGPESELVVRLLRRAVDEPDLTEQWDPLPAEPLLRAALRLDPRRRDVLIDRVVSRLGSGAADRSSEAAHALAEHAEALGEQHLTAIRQRAMGPPLADRLADVATLAKVEPSLITSATANAIVARAGQERSLLGSTEGEAAGELIRLVAATGELAEALPTLLAEIARMLTALVEAEDLTGLDRACALVDDLALGGHDIRVIVTAWSRELSGLPADRRHLLARRLWPHARSSAADDVVNVASALLDQPGGMAFLRADAETIAPAVREPFAAFLTNVVRADPTHAQLDDLLALLQSVSGSQTHELGAVIAREWAAARVPVERVARLIEQFDVAAGDTTELRGTLHRVAQVVPSSRDALDLLALAARLGPLDGHPGDALATTLGVLFNDVRRAEDVDVPTLWIAVGLAEELEADAQHVVQEMAESLIGVLHDASEERRRAIVDALRPIHKRLTREQRTELRAMAGS